MFHIVLHQPEIPPNTGNVIRLCANTGAHLHLVEPLGFLINDKTLARAGMDYAEISDVTRYSNWEACRTALGDRRFFALTTKGKIHFHTVRFEPEDVFVFGSESCGLPATVMEQFAPERRLRLPMQPDVRSINLSNTVAVVAYEAWRQLGFAGGV